MKQKILIISLILFSLFPLDVHALSGTIKITCDETNIKVTESTTCHITATTDDEVSSIHAELNVSAGLELTNVTKSSSWEGDNDQVLDLYTADNQTGTFEIADFTIKALKDGSAQITLVDITLGDKSFKEHSFTVSPYSITVSNNSTNESSSSTSSSSTGISTNSSSSSTPASSSSKPSSSSSAPASSSSLNASSSSQQSLKKPLYTIDLTEQQIYLGNQIELSFTANTAGLLTVTSSNSKIVTISSPTYNLSSNETKIFKLSGIKVGTAKVVVEFIPSDDQYQTIKENYSITVKSTPDPNANVDVNPPTGSITLFLIIIIGLGILGYSYWYYRTNKQN